MDQSVQSILNPILDPGECLLWSGQPRSGIRLRSQDAFLIPFSLLWGGFAIFWEIVAVNGSSKAHGTPGAAFPLFGLPFVAVGLYLIIGRFFVDALARSRTYYGVTNERIIILSGILSRQIKSLQLRTLTDVTLTERADRSGTITFGPMPPMSSFYWGNSYRGSTRYAPPCFDLVESAKQVYDAIRSAQMKAARS